MLGRLARRWRSRRVDGARHEKTPLHRRRDVREFLIFRVPPCSGARSGLGTLAFAWLPGLRRADPSTPLDKAVCSCGAAGAAKAAAAKLDAAAGGIIEQVGGGGETEESVQHLPSTKQRPRASLHSGSRGAVPSARSRYNGTVQAIGKSVRPRRQSIWNTSTKAMPVRSPAPRTMAV